MPERVRTTLIVLQVSHRVTGEKEMTFYRDSPKKTTYLSTQKNEEKHFHTGRLSFWRFTQSWRGAFVLRN